MDEVSAFSQISRSQIQVSQYNSWNQLIEINYKQWVVIKILFIDHFHT